MVKEKIRSRRKGAAIVRTKKGILVVAGTRGSYILPGGGADKGESRISAAIRELREETGLRAKSVRELGEYEGKVFRSHSGKKIKNIGKVYEIEASGRARPRNEIRRIGYWKQGSSLKISQGTRKLIERFSLQEIKR